MTKSASNDRVRRREQTTRALIDAARLLTSAQGFSGFTVEELCTQVGVSRRTFFNYFESKEHAVLGVPSRDSRMDDVDEAFAAATADGAGDVVTAFIELMATRWELFDPASDAPGVFAALDQEPRLHRSMFELMNENVARDIRLIERREGWDEHDPRAEVIVDLVAALVRRSAERVLQDPSESFRAQLTRRFLISRNILDSAQKDR